MSSIRVIAVLASLVFVTGVFVTPLAGSRPGHLTEDEVTSMSEGAEVEWRLPGGGVDCSSSCKEGLKCCGGNQAS